MQVRILLKPVGIVCISNYHFCIGRILTEKNIMLTLISYMCTDIQYLNICNYEILILIKFQLK